ncbi:MAG: hypothetical protein ACHQUC_01020 [Chlamydiales bacterium]
MNKKFLNHAKIVHAEGITTTIARQEIGKWLEKFEEFMNLFLKLNYFFKTDYPASNEHPDDWFFSFAYEKYLEAPYSLHVCNSLMERGYYLNAMIQLRSLLDYFVSCRYFHRHLQHIIPYRSGRKCLIDGKEKWLGPSEIYGFFSKDFYNHYYGDMLSSISHGKLGPAIYRFDRSNPLEERVIMMPEFNLRYAFSIINHLVPIVYGYLSHRLEFFNSRLKELPRELEREISEAVQWLKAQHEKQERNDWIEGINHIIGIAT